MSERGSWDESEIVAPKIIPFEQSKSSKKDGKGKKNGKKSKKRKKSKKKKAGPPQVRHSYGLRPFQGFLAIFLIACAAAISQYDFELPHFTGDGSRVGGLGDFGSLFGDNPKDPRPDQGAGSDVEEIPWRSGTAQDSTRGARMLNEMYVKSGKVVFTDKECWGTIQDFKDQIARNLTDRGAGRGKYIDPGIWRLIQVVAEDQRARKAPLPWVEVSCLARAHSIKTKSGNYSNHPLGRSVDFSVIGGWRIGYPAQHSGDKVSQAIKALWAAELYPRQIVSVHGRNGGIQDVQNPPIYDKICGSAANCGAFADWGGHTTHVHIDAPWR